MKTGEIFITVVDQSGKETKLFVAPFMTGCANPKFVSELTLALRQTLEPMIRILDR